MASSKETYCLCGQPYNIGQFMIECDCCREWFHGSCVDVKIYHSDDIDKYHCPKCAQTYGPSVFKIPTNNHRADRYELSAETRPSQVGTPAWVRALAARPMRPSQAALQRMRPHQFTEEFVRDNGFTRPVTFHSMDGLAMKTPSPATFTVRSVLRFCGAQMEVEVIDVRKQATLRMPLGEFVEYFETPPEHRDEKVLNVLSLEFSDTSLSPLVEPPGVVGALDWVETVWPPAEERPPRPAVQKYCLMSPAGAYTDFHVDFGGTTVWYHVLHGRKIFYLIPPTSTNLALYQQWSASNNQNERFFGDMVEWYGTAELNAGQTLFIPTGWIHAVLTPCDSLVFGGNFLHSYAIEMQLQIYEIERRVETPTMFRYPLFEAMHWYAGAYLLTMLRRHNEETQDEDFMISESYVASPPPDLPPLLLRGIKILANALKEWHALKSTDAAKRDNVPKCLNSGQLVRELCKELRTLEKRSASAANKDKDFKIKTATPKKSQKSQQSQKKSLKLTLPKPIMHMAQNGEYVEEKVYADKFYIDNKEVIYPDNRYMPQDVKYIENGMEAKYVVEGGTKDAVLPDKFAYQNYEEVQYSDGSSYVERQDKKGHVLRIKLNNPSSSRSPPPYPLPTPQPPQPLEHSILKSQLVRERCLKPMPQAQQWTISKKDIGDYQEEQILFTNENLQANMRVEGQEVNYGPGMYSAEDMQQDYQYAEKPAAYPGEYAFAEAAYPHQYTRYEPQPAPIQSMQSTATMSARSLTWSAATTAAAAATTAPPSAAHSHSHRRRRVPAFAPAKASPRPPKSHAFFRSPSTPPTPQRRHSAPQYSNVPVQEPLNGAFRHDQLPSYDAAIAQQQYATTTDYVIEEQKPATPVTPVRRSERPVRRRVSNTYDYEDGDLYIDDTPAPRRRSNKHKSSQKHNASHSSGYRQPAARPAPANGIESLIQASVLAEEEPRGDDTEDAAVAGMLSISSRYTAPQRTFGLPHQESPAPRNNSNTAGSSKRQRKPAAAAAPSSAEEFSDEEDVIKEVHRDEEYVYPSLEMSSDEDEEWSSSRRRRNSRHRSDSRAKSEKDESWSPRARLGRLVPRLRAPSRAGVRRECVRAALHAASAAKQQPPPQPPPEVHQNAKRAVLATKSRRPPPPAQPAPSNKNSRLKKGMKTAKQRLGKILKIHKMIY